MDQQPQFDRRPRASSKADTRGSTSTESSPALVGGHLSDDFNVYQQLPLSAPYLSARGSIGGELVSPLTRGEIRCVSTAFCAFIAKYFSQPLSARKALNFRRRIGIPGALHSQKSQPQRAIRRQEMRLTLTGEGTQTRR